MTLRKIGVLGLVADNGPIDFGDLARRLGLTKPVATRAVHTLGQLGFVKQQINPADHHIRIVSIIALGHEFRESQRLSGDAV